MLLFFYVNLRCCTISFMDSSWEFRLKAWIYGRVTERRSGRCDTCSDLVDFRVNPVWSNADIFFSIFPYGIQIQVHFHVGHFLAKGNQQLLVPIWGSNSSSFSCRSFSSQREPTVVGSINNSFNPLAPGKHGINSKSVVPKRIFSQVKFMSTSRWMPHNTLDNESTSLRAKPRFRQATSQCLGQCWPRPMSPYGLISTVALKGHHYISFSLHYINFDLCERNIMWLWVHNYLACIHNYLACIHKYLACIHDYLVCIHN